MAQVKLLSNGFENYTGQIGPYLFKDGVSDVISTADAERIGSMMKVSSVDAEGNVTGKNPGITQRMVDSRTIKAKVGPGMERYVSGDAEKRQVQTNVKDGPDAGPDAQTLAYDFTRESLEQLADKGGIAGLRSVANAYGVRGKAIKEMMDNLMARKTEWEKSQVRSIKPEAEFVEEPAEQDAIVLDADDESAKVADDLDDLLGV